MFQIKCLAIENAGHRVSASPDEVASFPDFWTIDGQLFRSAEGLMREAGGSTSLATLVKTIAGDHMNLPDGPILCGFGDYPLASDAARARKEIGRILANVRDRRVDLLWVTRADPPRWRTHQSPRVPRYASAGLRRRLSSRPVTFAVAPVDTFGLEEFTRVRAFNHLYVLYDAEVAPLLADLAEREESDEEFQPLGAVLWDILVRETAGLAPSVIVERIEAQYQRALSDGARRLVPISKLYDLTDFAVAITRPMWRTFDTSAWVRTDPNVFFDG